MNRLKEFRRKEGLTQEGAARKADIALRMYAFYEAGKVLPGLRAAQKLARMYNSSVEELFPQQDEEEAEKNALD